jgi:hypothetical protein
VPILQGPRKIKRTAIDIFQECGADGWVKKYDIKTLSGG